MKYRMVILPLDDLELCREAGLTDEQAERVIATSQVCNIDISLALEQLAAHMRAVAGAAAEVGKVLTHAPNHPNLADVLRELPQNRSDRRSNPRQEHRARSMHKPTGKPWDKRRGR